MRHPLDLDRQRATAIPGRLFARLDLRRVAPETALGDLIRAGGVVRAAGGHSGVRAWVEDSTGALILERDGIEHQAGNLIGLFFAPGTWTGILPVDARGAVTVTLRGVFDYSAAMTLEYALGGLRHAAEQAMTVGAPLTATVPELVAFLLNLMDNTAVLATHAAITDPRRLRRLLSPARRLREIRLAYEPLPVATPAVPVYLIADLAPGTRVRTIAL